MKRIIGPFTDKMHKLLNTQYGPRIPMEDIASRVTDRQTSGEPHENAYALKILASYNPIYQEQYISGGILSFVSFKVSILS